MKRKTIPRKKRVGFSEPKKKEHCQDFKLKLLTTNQEMDLINCNYLFAQG